MRDPLHTSDPLESARHAEEILGLARTGSDSVAARARADREAIHRRPEIGLHLPDTTDLVATRLSSLGLDVRRGQTTDWVAADIVGDPSGPTILLRADMDALEIDEHSHEEFASEIPHRMHACGHDIHTGMLLGAAEHLVNERDRLAGTVRLMFQPGEEGYHGARYMIEDGILDAVGDVTPVARAYALHMAPDVPVGMVGIRAGVVTAAVDTFTIEVVGAGGHGSTPEACNNPIPIAAEIILALQNAVVMESSGSERTVLTVGRVEALGQRNVIPERATLTGTIRTLSRRSRESGLRRIREIAEGIGHAHRADVVVDVDPGYPPTINDATEAERARTTATRLFGDSNVLEVPSAIMGSEDFSYVLEQVPGAYCWLGALSPNHDGPIEGCHSPAVVFDGRALRVGTALLVGLAFDSLDDLAHLRH